MGTPKQKSLAFILRKRKLWLLPHLAPQPCPRPQSCAPLEKALLSEQPLLLVCLVFH